MSKVTFEIKPVAWSGKTELKYQAFAVCGDRRIFGDPKPTRESAEKSLREEVSKWHEAVSEIKYEISKVEKL